MNNDIADSRRIVVKVGSNVLTRSDGKPNVTNLSSLVDQIAALRGLGHEVILVSSGAVACGRGVLKPQRQLDAVAQRQLLFLDRANTSDKSLQQPFFGIWLCGGAGAHAKGKFRLA